MYRCTCICTCVYVYISKMMMQDERNIYEIMKTMCPPGYHHNGFVATHALEHMMCGSSSAQVHELPQSHCGDNREATLFL